MQGEEIRGDDGSGQGTGDAAQTSRLPDKDVRASNEAMKQSAEAFLGRFRGEVLALARKPLRDLLGSVDVISLIRRIEADEASAALMPPRRDMLPSEDSFWFCVMQLDEFGAIDWPGAVHEPFLHYLHHDLKRAANCLAHTRNLPPGMIVQWMDDDDAEDWDAATPEGGLLDQMVTMRAIPGPIPGMTPFGAGLTTGSAEDEGSGLPSGKGSANGGGKESGKGSRKKADRSNARQKAGKGRQQGSPPGLMHFSIRLPDEPHETRPKSKAATRKLH